VKTLPVVLISAGFALGLLFPQARSAMNGAVVVNPTPAKWKHDAGDPPGSESIVIREDSQSGAVELFVRYPAGHIFSPHWHSANERILLIQGRLSIQVAETRTNLEPGGYAFLPAKEVQQISCTSSTQCTFYVHWDGKLDFHKGK
jgi:glyoxylate utilization-related uncharacterized protein